MKTQPQISRRKGFTLMELMVAMAITTIIVSVLVSVTSMALETWNRSRAELKASRQGKVMIDTMARDFEALVTRRGNTSQWLSAISPASSIGGKLKSTNASEFIFFTAATDRYDGKIGGTGDNGGDVSCVAYKLSYRDPISSGGGSNYETFVMNRKLVNPDETFKKILGQAALDTAFNSYKADLDKPESFICENVYQFSVTFHVEVARVVSGTTTLIDVPLTVGNGSSSQTVKSLKFNGTGIEIEGPGVNVTQQELAAGRLKSVGISVTVISDFGMDQLRNRGFSGTQQSEFLAKHSYNYSKLVQVSSM